MNLKSICKKLNKLITDKEDGFIDKVNELIYEMHKNGGGLYWDRNVLISCNGDEDKMKELVRNSDLVEFVVTDDPEEHPGVKVKYKEDIISDIHDMKSLLTSMKEEIEQKKIENIDNMNMMYYSGQADLINTLLRKMI